VGGGRRGGGGGRGEEERKTETLPDDGEDCDRDLTEEVLGGGEVSAKREDVKSIHSPHDSHVDQNSTCSTQDLEQGGERRRGGSRREESGLGRLFFNVKRLESD
jgi:hypothetical protein